MCLPPPPAPRRRARRLAAPGLLAAVALAATAATAACAGAQPRAQPRTLGLGFAVDTAATPRAVWGMDAARDSVASVVRAWRAYLQVRGDPVARRAAWSAADRARHPDPDLQLAAAGYIADASPTVVDVQPLRAGDASAFVVRTLYTGSGSAEHPGVLALERVHVVREGGRWALAHPIADETRDWRRARVGAIEYVVHPSQPFDTARAAATARWTADVARRFGVAPLAPLTYYQLPDLEAQSRLLGFDLALVADRVGGRADVRNRLVLAADPRFGPSYHHEIAHVVLQPVVGGMDAFWVEGVAYWLGGSRGMATPAMLQSLAAWLAARPGLGLREIVDGDDAASQSVRFPAAAAVLELVHRRGGDPAVRRLLARAGAVPVTFASLSTAAGMSAAELEQAWRAVLRAQ